MAEGKRQANIELLRVVLMAMIVVMHFLREAGLLPETGFYGRLSGCQWFALVLEAFCIVAVNAYVFISGYFGRAGAFRLSKAAGFLCRIWFYALLIPAVLKACSVPILYDEVGIYSLAQYLFPIEAEHYWFATSYFFLLLFMPFLQIAADKLSKKQFQVSLCSLLLMVCGVKSISPVHFATDRYGYDVIWFICVYLTAAYCRRYGLSFIKRHAGKVYGGSCFVIFSMTVILWYLVKSFPAAAYYYSVPFHYNFIFALIGAMGLFFLFEGFSVPEGRAAEWIRKAGKYSFGVYLLHEHVDIRKKWYPFLDSILNPSGKETFGMLIFELVISLLLLFAAGLVTDCIRELLFQKMAGLLKNTALIRQMKKLDEEK